MPKPLRRLIPALLFAVIVGSGLQAQQVLHLRKPAGATRPAEVHSKVSLPLTDGFERTSVAPWVQYVDTPPYWGLTTYRKNGGAKSLYCVQSGTGGVAAPGPYVNGAQGWITYGPFSTSGATSSAVSFKLWQAMAGGGDLTAAGYSLDDINYDTLQWTSNTAGWETKTVPMNNAGWTTNYLDKAQVYFSFYFETDASGTAEGAYVDDVSIAVSGGGGGSGTVNGTITGPYSRKLAGACVTINGGTNNYKYTGDLGTFSFGSLTNGSYTIVPKRPGYVFTPAQRTVTVSGNTVAANFTAALATGDGVVKKWALLVGISDYEGTINDLNYCDDDARDMRSALIQCGFPAANVTTLIDSQATKAAIRAGINSLCTNADADDIVVFFDSGHGGQEADVAPLDEPDNLDEQFYPYEINSLSISDDEVAFWFRLMKSMHYLVMFDTCNSGGHFRSITPQFFDWAPEGAVGTRDLDDLVGGVVISACRDDQLSQEADSLQNGVFTYYVVQGLLNSYADANQNGQISAEEVYSYALPRATAFNYEQTAEMWDGHPGELEFARPPTIISASVPARNAVAFAAANNLSITFRWDVNQTSAESCFALKDSAGRVVPGVKSWSTAKKVMVFNPTASLMADVQYTVEIAPGLTLDSGAVKWYSDSFTFKTAPATSPALAMTGTAQAVRGGGAQIRIQLSAAATVMASITNLAGREVAVLAPTESPAGASALLWNGKSASGLAVPPGQYLVRLQAVDASGNAATSLAPLRK